MEAAGVWGWGPFLPLEGQGSLGNLGAQFTPHMATACCRVLGRAGSLLTWIGAPGALSPVAFWVLAPHEMEPGCLGSVLSSAAQL